MVMFGKNKKEEIMDLREVKEVNIPKRHQIIWANKNNVPLTKKNRAANSSKTNISSPELNQEIESLTEQISFLTKRIRAIEVRLGMANNDYSYTEEETNKSSSNSNEIVWDVDESSSGGGIDDSPRFSHSYRKDMTSKHNDITENFADSGETINFF